MTEISDKINGKSDKSEFNILRVGDKPPIPKKKTEHSERPQPKYPDYPGPSFGQRVYYGIYTLPEKMLRAMSRAVHWWGGPGPEDLYM